jgi:uncharacterized membrane protein
MFQLLPSGFALPPVPYLLVVLGGVALALLSLGLARPAVREATVLALSPWMVVGAGLYALYQVDAVPDVLAPFFGSPVVYLTVFAVLGFVWGLASLVGGPEFAAMVVVIAGAGLVLAVLGLAVVVGVTEGTLSVAWPGAGVLFAVVLSGLAWVVLDRLAPDATRVTGAAGGLVVFAHVLDGVSTAVGVDRLGFGEQTPLSAAIIDLGAGLPAEPLLGTAWLFVAVKLLLAMAVVVLVAGYVEEEPTEGYVLLALVAAVGLGPGVHNVVLFSIAPDPTAAAALPASAPALAAVPDLPLGPP